MNVRELIALLEALPEEDKDLRVVISSASSEYGPAAATTVEVEREGRATVTVFHWNADRTNLDRIEDVAPPWVVIHEL